MVCVRKRSFRHSSAILLHGFSQTALNGAQSLIQNDMFQQSQKRKQTKAWTDTTETGREKKDTKTDTDVAQQ